MPEPSLPYVTTKEALEKQLKAYLRVKGVVAPVTVPVLVEFIQDRLKAQRDRLATLVENLQGMYESLSPEQMDTLANMIRNHVVDERGNVIPMDD